MDQNAKQLAVERLKNSANLLITVRANPEVDDLSAMIGFSLLMSKLNKHASAVFSGQIPPAINFLQPDKRVEKDVSSLRDFIIALDKSKADKLRYKVEDNVVKIFITPYRSRISQEDLTFSEGDFNVDTVVALGAHGREDLDNALKAHGRILHDATVITVNAGNDASGLGVIDWLDPSASSLCEMLVSISESFGSGLLDEQISTAFLTGIVAATDHFSNNKTTPKVMTMAAQLMAAGANQQLISNNLQIKPQSAPPPPAEEDVLSINHQDKPTTPQETALPPPQAEPAPPPPPKVEPKPPPPLPPAGPQPAEPKEKSIKQLEEEIAKMATAKSQDEKTPEVSKRAAGPQLEPKKPYVKDEPKSQDNEQLPKNQISRSKGHGPRETGEDPLMGGTFNATSQQAHEENVSDLKNNVNSTLLSHPDKSPDEEVESDQDRPIAKAPPIEPVSLDKLPPQAPPPPESTPPTPPPAEGAELDVDAARQAVTEAVNTQDFNPARNPLESIGSQPLSSEEPESADTEISIDQSGNLQRPGQTTNPAAGDTNQEFKLPQ